MQNFRAMGAKPPDPRAPKPPASGGWGLRPQTPLVSGGWGLRPQTPQTTPPLRISGYAPGIERRSSVSVTDARPLIGPIFFFLHPTKTSLPNSHHNTLDWPYVMLFVKKVEKNSRLNYLKDNTTSRDS